MPSFFVEGDGEHSIAEQIRFCRSHLAYLHVSAGYRRPGIAAHSVQGLFKAASDGGARQISVSAMPSESAVGFYLARGFSPVDEPLPELYELERDDIHMIRDL